MATTFLSAASLLSKIPSSSGSPLITYDQGVLLDNLKISQTDEPILSADDKDFLYEIAWLINALNFDTVYRFLSINWNEILKLDKKLPMTIRQKRRYILFRNPLLSNQRKKLIIDLDIFRNQVLISDSAVDCGRCGSKETISVEKQVRAADEPASIKITCLQCGNKWTAQ